MISVLKRKQRLLVLVKVGTNLERHSPDVDALLSVNVNHFVDEVFVIEGHDHCTSFLQRRRLPHVVENTLVLEELVDERLQRLRRQRMSGEELEMLRLTIEFTAVASDENLRERMEQLLLFLVEAVYRCSCCFCC